MAAMTRTGPGVCWPAERLLVNYSLAPRCVARAGHYLDQVDAAEPDRRAPA